MSKYAKDIGANQKVIDQLKIYQGKWVDVIGFGSSYGSGYGSGYGSSYSTGCGYGTGIGFGNGSGFSKVEDSGLETRDD